MLKAKIKVDFDAILSKTKKEVGEQLRELAPKVLSDLVDSTPIDTGEARAGWKVTQTSPTSFEATNDVEHIVFLNAGSSQQAPSYFIEQTAMKYGKPNGPIVTNN